MKRREFLIAGGALACAGCATGKASAAKERRKARFKRDDHSGSNPNWIPLSMGYFRGLLDSLA